MLALEDGVFGVQIANVEGSARCEFEIQKSKSVFFDFNSFDDILEASIKICSIALKLKDYQLSQVKIDFDIENGEYSVGVFYLVLDSTYDYFQLTLMK